MVMYPTDIKDSVNESRISTPNETSYLTIMSIVLVSELCTNVLNRSIKLRTESGTFLVRNPSVTHSSDSDYLS